MVSVKVCLCAHKLCVIGSELLQYIVSRCERFYKFAVFVLSVQSQIMHADSMQHGELCDLLSFLCANFNELHRMIAPVSFLNISFLVSLLFHRHVETKARELNLFTSTLYCRTTQTQQKRFVP